MFYKTLATGTKTAYFGLFGLNPDVIMNILHALGFFVFGLAMAMLPELAPAFAPPDVAFGNVAELWLEFMGGVMFLIGSGYTAKCITAALPKSVPQPNAPATAPAKARAQSALASTANRAAV
ncbi:MAG TPA: hypothetical protein VGP21_07885 [Opitutaceae bacterium]|jgi:hypothetical protein|nr:hypothetical protein [Opitutaceae bacterium]